MFSTISLPMMHAILFCFCCTLFLYSTVSAKSLQFISASGSTKSPSQIVDFLAQTNVKVEKGLFVVDCTPGCSSLINRLFKIEITSESGKYFAQTF